MGPDSDRGEFPALRLDYYGFASGWPVGYGTDYQERYRGLPGLHQLLLTDVQYDHLPGVAFADPARSAELLRTAHSAGPATGTRAVLTRST